MFRKTISIAALTAATVATLAGTASAAFPGTNGRIAFQSNRDGNLELYSMTATGTEVTRLTNNAAQDRDAVFRCAGCDHVRTGGGAEVIDHTLD